MKANRTLAPLDPSFMFSLARDTVRVVKTKARTILFNGIHLMKSLSLAVLLLLSIGSTLQADLILTWNTFGNEGIETTQASTFNQFAGPSTLTLGAGVSAAANGDRFGGRAWFNAGNTLADAITNNDYIQFIVTPTQTINLTSFDFRWESSGTGPNSLALRSSVDSFASNLGAVVSILRASPSNDQIAVLNSISLTGMQISSATTFRLYGFGATNVAGTGGFDTTTNSTNVILNGTAVTAVPEPSSLLLLGMLSTGLAAVRSVSKRRASDVSSAV